MSFLAVIADCEKHITVTDFNFQKKMNVGGDKQRWHKSLNTKYFLVPKYRNELRKVIVILALKIHAFYLTWWLVHRPAQQVALKRVDPLFCLNKNFSSIDILFNCRFMAGVCPSEIKHIFVYYHNVQIDIYFCYATFTYLPWHCVSMEKLIRVESFP